MSSITSTEIKQEFLKSKIGIAGIAILASLVLISISAAIFIPIDTFKEWNNPGSWISFPKTSMPSWVNLFMFEKIPEHKVVDSFISSQKTDEISLISQQFNVNYEYDDFPNDFIYEFTATYSGSPLLQVIVIRPDGTNLKILSTSLPYSETETVHNDRVFSTDESIKKNILLQSEKFEFPITGYSSQDLIFAKTSQHSVLKGNYIFFSKFVWSTN